MGVLKKFSSIVALSVGLGLSVATVQAAPAAAVPTVPTGSDLEELLLTEKDLPRGYTGQELPDADEIFREVIAGYDVDQDVCSAPGVASMADMPDQRPYADPANMRDPMKVRDPADMRDPMKAHEPADMREPVKAYEPADMREPVKAYEPVKGEQGESAAAVFVNERKGLFALELLADTGQEVAVDMVSDTMDVLEECPTIEQEGVELTMSPLRWKPRLGDESVGLSMVLRVTDADFEMNLYGKLVVVAQDDLSVTVGLVGLEEPRERDLKKIARAAVQKIEDVEPAGSYIVDRTEPGRNP